MTAAPKTVALAAAMAVLVAGALVVLAGDDYELRVRFANAGQLVKGGEVRVAGRNVGSIRSVGLVSGGVAEVVISVDDERVRPLHAGTRAAIRAVGSAGIANRFIELSPGSRGEPALRSGDVIDRDQTSDIVELDSVLDSFGPQERRKLRALIASSDEVFAGSGARSFNDMLGRLNPGLRQVRRLTEELAEDREDIGRAIRASRVVADAMASRDDDLRNSVAGLARSFRIVADERASLSGSLRRAPAVLRAAKGTLARTSATVRALRPALRDLPAAAGPLGRVLRSNTAMSKRARPVLAELRRQLPNLRQTLAALPRLEPAAVKALRSTPGAMRDVRPIAAGLRYYGADLILGLINGLAGITTGTYDDYGHYLHLNLVQSPQTAAAGPLAELLSGNELVPGIFGTRTRLLRRCPGGNAPPAPDGSSPWNLGKKLCSEEHNTPASVNEP